MSVCLIRGFPKHLRHLQVLCTLDSFMPSIKSTEKHWGCQPFYVLFAVGKQNKKLHLTTQVHAQPSRFIIKKKEQHLFTYFSLELLRINLVLYFSIGMHESTQPSCFIHAGHWCSRCKHPKVPLAGKQEAHLLILFQSDPSFLALLDLSNFQPNTTQLCVLDSVPEASMAQIHSRETFGLCTD